MKAFAWVVVLCLVSSSFAEHALDAASRATDDAVRATAPIAGDCGGAAKPGDIRYDRVLVTTGGGLNSAVFLGEVDALVEAGWKPDLIIATCGSSLAASLIHTLGDGRKGWDYIGDPLRARELHTMLSLAKIKQGTVIGAGGKLVPLLARDKAKGLGFERLVPNIWSKTVVEVPDDFSKLSNQAKLPIALLDKKFEDRGIRVLFVAGKPLFDKKRVGESAVGTPLFEEILFTDPGTAKKLNTVRSRVGTTYRDSAVSPYLEVVTDQLVIVASRAAISDPYYINSGLVNGKPYVGSAIDLYPIEIAKLLGKDVMMTYSQPVDSYTDTAFQQIFGYSMAARAKEVAGQEAEYWLDNSDINNLYQSEGFEPRMGFFQRQLLMDGLPQDLASFRRRSLALYNYGRYRAREALKHRCSKEHIRLPYHDKGK